MPSSSKKPGRRGSGRDGAFALSKTRSSASCSGEWFRRSSRRGGCFGIVVSISTLFALQLIAFLTYKDVKNGQMFHGLHGQMKDFCNLRMTIKGAFPPIRAIFIGCSEM